MSTSFRIYAHIDVVDELGERDDEDRHVSPSYIPSVRIQNCITNVGHRYWKVIQVVSLMADVQIRSDGSRDWIYCALGVRDRCCREFVDPEDMGGFIDIVGAVCDNKVKDLRDFAQYLEGHPDVDVEEDEDGQLFAEVLKTCESIRDQWDTEMSGRASYFIVETYRGHNMARYRIYINGQYKGSTDDPDKVADIERGQYWHGRSVYRSGNNTYISSRRW